ncbi:MAG: penicillin-insensitive murein endopeptidase [Hyphomicrobiaceae bacterium]|nr:penicillin-insensitive murein endopeptidase [Hyphomicrobiaceae bacterium]
MSMKTSLQALTLALALVSTPTAWLKAQTVEGTSTVTETAPAPLPAAPDTKTVKSTLPAKALFGKKTDPAALAARAIGFYSRGCLSGAKALPVDGPAWQAMRLSRNRNWGHPELLKLIERLAVEAKAAGDWPGLLVGDLAQPRGGPMLTGHSSHQVGLDADIWLTPMPDKRLSFAERETLSATNMVTDNGLDVVTGAFTDKTVAVIRRAASYPEVERIGVNWAIKVGLCRAEGGDKPWLGKIQGWPGHTYHMHIRMKCPAGSEGCQAQGEPGGTSCAAAEAWYADTKAWVELPADEKKKRIAEARKTAKPSKPKPELTLDDLPAECRVVLASKAAPAAEALADIVPPSPKPAVKAAVD